MCVNLHLAVLFMSLTEKGGFMLSGFIFVLMSSLSWGAVDAGEPENFCAYGCSEMQQQIWSSFEQSNFTATEMEPSLFSGGCYHLTSMFRNTDKHHGVFYISEVEGKLHASGRFQFYGEGYDGMKLADVEREFPDHALANRELLVMERSRHLDYSSQDTPVLYWFRHSDDKEKIYLIGQWGFSHTMFCELIKHHQ
jgi:hypothetical protein